MPVLVVVVLYHFLLSLQCFLIMWHLEGISYKIWKKRVTFNHTSVRPYLWPSKNEGAQQTRKGSVSKSAIYHRHIHTRWLFSFPFELPENLCIFHITPYFFSFYNKHAQKKFLKLKFPLYFTSVEAHSLTPVTFKCMYDIEMHCTPGWIICSTFL